MSNPALWFVYLLRCADGSYYSGVTTDPARRQHEHNNSIKGARYTRSRRPVEMVWIQDCEDRSQALRLEFFVKRQSHDCKALLGLDRVHLEPILADARVVRCGAASRTRVSAAGAPRSRLGLDSGSNQSERDLEQAP